jgi:hypothetical protein
MTRYEQGFMSKCAEYGVDADTAIMLMQKNAGFFSSAIGKGRKAGMRLWELLRGGNADVLKDYNNAKGVARRWMDSGIKYRNDEAYRVGDTLLNELASARWGGPARTVRVNTHGKIGRGGTFDTSKIVNGDVKSELNKVLAARAGAGAAGLGGLAMLAGGGTDYA